MLAKKAFIVSVVDPINRLWNKKVLFVVCYEVYLSMDIVIIPNNAKLKRLIKIFVPLKLENGKRGSEAEIGLT